MMEHKLCNILARSCVVLLVGKGVGNIYISNLNMNSLVSQSDHQKLGGGFKYLFFSSLPGEMIQFD